MSDDIRTAIIEDPDVLQFAQDGWTLRVTVPGGVTSYLLRQGGRWHGPVLEAITEPTMVERLELLNPDEQLPLGHVTVTVPLDIEEYAECVARGLAGREDDQYDRLHALAELPGLPTNCTVKAVGLDADTQEVTFEYSTDLGDDLIHEILNA